MRTHTAIHSLWCDLERLEKSRYGRKHGCFIWSHGFFEIEQIPEGFANEVEELCNAEIKKDRPVEVSFYLEITLFLIGDLIRTKITLYQNLWKRYVSSTSLVLIDRLTAELMSLLQIKSEELKSQRLSQKVKDLKESDLSYMMID